MRIVQDVDDNFLTSILKLPVWTGPGTGPSGRFPVSDKITPAGTIEELSGFPSDPFAKAVWKKGVEREAGLSHAVFAAFDILLHFPVHLPDDGLPSHEAEAGLRQSDSPKHTGVHRRGDKMPEKAFCRQVVTGWGQYRRQSSRQSLPAVKRTKDFMRIRQLANKDYADSAGRIAGFFPNRYNLSDALP